MGCSSIPRSRGLIIILFVFRGDAEPAAAVRVEPDAGEVRALQHAAQRFATVNGHPADDLFPVLAAPVAAALVADHEHAAAAQHPAHLAEAVLRFRPSPRPDIPRSRLCSSPTQGGTRPSPTVWSRSSCRHKNCCFRSCGKRCEWRLFCPSEIILLSPAPVNVL